MRRGRLARLRQLAGTAAGVGGHLAVASQRKAAERLAAELGDMKGLPLKLGQMLSYIDDMVPERQREQWSGVLSRLQAHTPQVPRAELEAIVEEDFPGLTLNEVLGAASIGQVFACDWEGQDAVAKVQYPGIAQAFEADLANVDALVRAMNAVLPKTDVAPIMREVAASQLDELDYTQEAKNQADFRSIWAGAEDVRIPAPYAWTERVLVSERVYGAEWAEAKAAPKPIWGRAVFRFGFGSLYEHGLFNGDPHPGNYLFQPDGVAFIDFGSVQRYPDEVCSVLHRMREKALAGQQGDLKAEVSELLQVDLPSGPDRLFTGFFELALKPLWAPQPFRFDRAYTHALTELGMQTKLELSKGAFLHGVPIPHRRGATLLTRLTFGLASILAGLDAEDDWPELLA